MRGVEVLRRFRSKIDDSRLLWVFNQLKKKRCMLSDILGKGIAGTLSRRRIEQLFKETSKRAGVVLTPGLMRKILLQHEIDRSRNRTDISPTKIILREEKLKKLDGFQQILIGIGLETGLSTSDICSARISDIKNGRLIINTRKITLSDSLLRNLRLFNQGRNKNEIIFAGNRGTISQRRIQQQFIEISDILGIRISPRILRRAYAYKLHLAGRSNEEIAQVLGVKTVDAHRFGFYDLGGAA